MTTCRPRAFMVGALVLVATSVTGCGESAQEKAQANVCSARSEISKQIAKVQGLTVSSTATTELKTSLEVIGKELGKIRDAQPDLTPARKQQVEPAVKTFEAELKTIAAGVVATATSGNLESAVKEAGTKVKSAGTALAGSYRQALAPISCP